MSAVLPPPSDVVILYSCSKMANYVTYTIASAVLYFRLEQGVIYDRLSETKEQTELLPAFCSKYATLTRPIWRKLLVLKLRKCTKSLCGEPKFFSCSHCSKYLYAKEVHIHVLFSCRFHRIAVKKV